MTAREKPRPPPAASSGHADVLVPADSKKKSIPVWLARDVGWSREASITTAHKTWLTAQGFRAAAGRHVLLPAADGSIAGVVLGLGNERRNDPMDKPELALGILPSALPPGLYHLTDTSLGGELAAVAWGLGAYRFRRYKTGNEAAVAQLRMPRDASHARALAAIEAIWLGRDLINTPAADLGPQQLEDATRNLGKHHGAKVVTIVGEDLLTNGLGMIHAVGRASDRAPRLIDLTWGRDGAPRVTLIGKGICFDTGGLDLKPPSAMLIMKKDMGGAATALALGHMVMAEKLDVALRILIPAAENSVAGNAFRPGDVLASRIGKSVEIGNTDAEGRLVLADAMALADEERPDTLLTFATLTGAARVALGPDLPPFYTDDDTLAEQIAAAGNRVGDPVWRLPFWTGYETTLDSNVADMNNVSDGPFAGSVTAALFLRRFVKEARRFAHFDIYGWRPATKPLGPKGGEPHAARAMFEVLRTMCPPRGSG